LPFKSPGAARAFIDYAEITPEDKNKIAGGNLARLFKVDLPAPVAVQNDY
jgi:predicted TIM-barrel fold metal-dependent hydrolase